MVPNPLPSASRKRKKSRKLTTQKKKGIYRLMKEKTVETVSKFHLVGPEMTQMYMVHYENWRTPCTLPAIYIESTCIHLFWTETFQAIAMNLEKMKTAELTQKEQDAHKEHLISVKNWQKLKAAGIPLQVGEFTGCLHMDINRCNHRLAIGHPDPFGGNLEEGDCVEFDDEDSEDPTNPKKKLSKVEIEELKKLIDEDLKEMKARILAGKTTMEEVEKNEDANFVKALKKFMEDSEGNDDE